MGAAVSRLWFLMLRHIDNFNHTRAETLSRFIVPLLSIVHKVYGAILSIAQRSIKKRVAIDFWPCNSIMSLSHACSLYKISPWWPGYVSYASSLFHIPMFMYHHNVLLSCCDTSSATATRINIAPGYLWYRLPDDKSVPLTNTANLVHMERAG